MVAVGLVFAIMIYGPTAMASPHLPQIRFGGGSKTGIFGGDPPPHRCADAFAGGNRRRRSGSTWGFVTREYGGHPAPDSFQQVARIERSETRGSLSIVPRVALRSTRATNFKRGS